MKTLQQLWTLIERRHRREAGGLFVLMLVGMGLEMLGVGMVIPVIAVLTTHDLQARFPQIGQYAPWILQHDQRQVIVVGVLALAGIYGAKNLFLAFLAWRQGKLVFSLHANLSQRLLANYLRQPYAFHLQHNSAQLIRNVVNEVNLFTNAAQMAMMLLAEMLVLTGIAFLLIIIEPLGTLLAGAILGVAAWIFFRVIRTSILQDGKSRQHYDGLRIQHVQQGLGAIKDIKLLGREADFLQKYQINNTGNSKALQRQYFHQQLPRLWLEVLAVAGLAVIALSLLGKDGGIATLLSTLGLFGAAAFRMMPSINRCMTALQTIRFAMPVIGNLHHELVVVSAPEVQRTAEKLQFASRIEIENLQFSYPGASRPTLDGVSLVIPFGASVGFIGGSGAGKTTLVDLTLGLLSPTGGKVTVDGVDIQTALRGWQNLIGYVPQFIFLTDDTLRRNIGFGLADDQIDEELVWRALRAAQLEKFVRSLPEGLGTTVGERGVRLSGGQRQRIGIARALYHDPQVLVLDEATSSLDVETETGVMRAVSAMHGQKTILIVTHRLTTVESCDFLVHMQNGRLIEGAGQRIPLPDAETARSTD